MQAQLALKPDLPAAPAPPSWGRPAGKDPVPFRRDYRLWPGNPLAELDQPCARAFAAEDLKKPERSVYCLISEPTTLPRHELLAQLQIRPVEGLPTLLAHGTSEWPGSSSPMLALVLERPGGPRLELSESWTPSEIARRLLTAVVPVLHELHQRGFAHRAVRPVNLFWADPARTHLVLGECLSSPPGHDQPSAFETVENALAEPAARCPGSMADDMFALGVTVLAILRRSQIFPHGDPLSRLERGSFSALIGDRLPGEIVGLLRGLLADEPDARWGPDEVLRWSRGHHMLANRAVAPLTAMRPFTIGGDTFRTARALAYGLVQEGRPAATALRSGSVEQWLRASLRSDQLADQVERLRKKMARFGVGQPHLDDSIVAQAALILDPAGPLRLGSLSMMPEAIGSGLAARATAGQPLDDFARLIDEDVIGAVPTARIDAAGLTGRFAKLRGFLQRRGPMGGIERCLYELNPRLPCLSPLVGAAFPVTVAQALQALDTYAATADPESSPLDAHLAGFIAAHLDLPPLRGADSVGPADRAIWQARTELWLLAAAQAGVGAPPLPNLCRWLAARMGPIVRTLYSRQLRKQVVGEVGRTRDSGQLNELRAVLENPELWRRDRQGVNLAQQEHARNRHLLSLLADPKRSGLAEAIETGERYAAATAIVLAGLTLAVMALL